MRLIIFGSPGSGKGTQAKIIAKKFNLKHISTGDLLRKEVEKGTELGKKISAKISKGEYVDFKTMVKVIKKELPKDNFIIDGFPRTLEQAKELDNLSNIDKVIVLDVPYHTLKSRLLKRAKLEGRTDDNEETIKKRFKIYREETSSLIRYYKDKIILLDGDRIIEEITKDIFEMLRQ